MYIYSHLLLVYGLLPSSENATAVNNNNNNNNNNNSNIHYTDAMTGISVSASGTEHRCGAERRATRSRR